MTDNFFVFSILVVIGPTELTMRRPRFVGEGLNALILRDKDKEMTSARALRSDRINKRQPKSAAVDHANNFTDYYPLVIRK
jgi:hypothetical protein